MSLSLLLAKVFSLWSSTRGVAIHLAVDAIYCRCLKVFLMSSRLTLATTQAVAIITVARRKVRLVPDESPIVMFQAVLTTQVVCIAGAAMF